MQYANLNYFRRNEGPNAKIRRRPLLRQPINLLLIPPVGHFLQNASHLLAISENNISFGYQPNQYSHDNNKQRCLDKCLRLRHKRYRGDMRRIQNQLIPYDDTNENTTLLGAILPIAGHRSPRPNPSRHSNFNRPQQFDRCHLSRHPELRQV